MTNGLSGYYDIKASKGVIVRIKWNEKYDTSTNKHQVFVNDLQIKTSNTSGHFYYLDGDIKINNNTIITFSSELGSHGIWGYSGSYSSVVAQGNYDAPPWDSVLFSGNNDGTSSANINVTLTGYTIDGGGDNAWKITSSSKTIKLTNIPRQSSITSVSNITLGNKCNVKWIPNSKTFYYKLRFYIGNWNYTTPAIHPNITTTYTYSSYTVPTDVSRQIINKEVGTMTVSLTTYSDSACKNKIGSTSSKTFSVTVPKEFVPRIMSADFKINNTNPKLKEWNLAVVGYTSVDINATAIGVYDSTIKSYFISGYNATIEGSVLNYKGRIFGKSGNIAFDISCKDSRGRQSSQYLSPNIFFYSYSNPTISNFYAKRNNDGSISVKADWSISSINGKNNAVCTLFYKKATEISWKEYGKLSKNVEQKLTGDFQEINSYNFRVVVKDELGNSVESTSFVSTISVLLDYRAGGRGLGIGKITESDSLEIALPTKFYKQIEISGKNVIDFIIEEGVYDAWKYRKWFSGVSECWGSFSKKDYLNTKWGAIYSGIDIAPMKYPVGLFSVRPVENVTIHGNRDSWLVNTSGNNQLESGAYRCASATTTSVQETIIYDFHVIGMWK